MQQGQPSLPPPDAVVEYAAAVDGDHVTVTHDGTTWDAGDPALDEHLSASMGVPVAITPEGRASHMDDSPVSIIGTASLRWCAERYGGLADPRRLRPNLVVATDEPFVEDSWVGREAQLGEVRLRLTATTVRCRTIDVAQDGVTDPRPWLKPLGERDLELAVYAEVLTLGTIRRTDRLEIC